MTMTTTVMAPTVKASSLIAARRNPVIRLFSSVWFGIILLTLILIYSSLVSAIAPIRWTLEVTEMQAFRHWLFVTLTILFMAAMITTTIVRIRWTFMNTGVLLAHVGLLTLAGGAIAYFSTKVEGDLLLQAPAIEIRAKVGDQTGIMGRFRAVAEESWSQQIPFLRKPLAAYVLDTQSRGIQPVATAHVAVQLGDEEPRLITLTNRAGDWQKINDSLDIRLQTFEPATTFYDDETPALYFTNMNTGASLVKKIKQLPIHREHYVDDGAPLKDILGRDVPSRRVRPEIRLAGLAIPTGWFEPWRMPIDVESDDLPFSIEVTGYLPAVRQLDIRRLADGRQVETPVLEAPENRRPDTSPRSQSAIRLKITGAGAEADWSETRWCAFSSWIDAETHPMFVRIPESNEVWQVVYSRARYDLGAALTARNLSVNFFPGQRGVDSWNSDIVVQKHGDENAIPVRVATNQTYTVGHWTLFQSGFDGEGHWAWTVLGVGNRIGLLPMNIGWITVAAGCLFAFYIKPALIRRNKRRLGLIGG